MKSPTQHIDLSAVAARVPLTPLALILSCLFSLIVILQNPLLNDDAYKYLRAAELFNTEGVLAVLESVSWPYYAFLIALADKVLPGGPIVAAHVLNTALYALLTYAFLLLVRELRDTPRIRLFAAVCILAFPLTNEMRFFLIRDTGFWAFALLSLVWLIRHNRSGDTRMALWWSITLVLACVFRIEGMLLLAFAPWSLLLPDAAIPLKERAERCGRLVGILAAVALSVLLVAMLAGLNLPSLIGFAYRWYLPLLGDLTTLLNGAANGVGAALFTPDNFPGSDNTALALAIALFAYALALLFNLVEALSPPLAILLLAGHFFSLWITPPTQARRALNTYAMAMLLALILFMLMMHFTTQRYATLLALLLLAQVPLVLDELYTRTQSSEKRSRYFHIGFIVLVFYYLVDSLFSFGHSHRHIEDAIAWTREQLPAGAQMKTNNFAIGYHSGHVRNYDQIVRDAALVIGDTHTGDYLVLELDDDADTSALDTDPRFVRLQHFVNERDDQVLVYLHR